MNVKKLFFAFTHLKDIVKDARIAIASTGVLYEYIFLNIYRKQFKSFLELNGYDNNPLPGEIDFQKKWGGGKYS